MDDKSFEMAKELLKNLEFPVEEIPHSVGYRKSGYPEFSIDFKRRAGVTPKRYRKHHVVPAAIEEAKFYLAQTDASVDEVASVTVFATSKIMSKIFEKRLKTSPLAYRKEAYKSFNEYSGFKNEREQFMHQAQLDVVERAAPLLVDSDISVQAVADAVGVNRVRLFRYFKAVHDKSPDKYRKHARISRLVGSLASAAVQKNDIQPS